MTERNFTTIIPGWYRTRDGALAEVLHISDPRFRDTYSVRGFINGVKTDWKGDGESSTHCGPARPGSLITFIGTEKPKETRMVKKTLTRWANVYKSGVIGNFTTKENAEESSFGCIACVELTGEYEVEEEV